MLGCQPAAEHLAPLLPLHPQCVWLLAGLPADVGALLSLVALQEAHVPAYKTYFCLLHPDLHWHEYVCCLETKQSRVSAHVTQQKQSQQKPVMQRLWQDTLIAGCLLVC